MSLGEGEPLHEGAFAGREAFRQTSARTRLVVLTQGE